MKGRRNKSDTVCTNDEVSLILKLDKVELGETNIFSLGNLENSFVSSKYYLHTCFLEMFVEENDFTYDNQISQENIFIYYHELLYEIVTKNA